MKSINRLIAMAFSVAMLAGCGQNGGNVVITSSEGIKVRVTPVTDRIFRVSAVPGKAEFSEKESLVVMPVKDKPSFEVTEDEKCVTIATKAAKAIVSKQTGAVRFTDAEGNVYTSEAARSFSPIEADGDRAWTVSQVFNSPEDEAFYGLGQHQADEWNYKGRNEELYQYNTKISVPFVVSSKRYGILWDSYSLCRWGDPREYAQLGEVFKMYDKDGVEGALTGTYTPRNGEPLVRRETQLAQEFLRTPQCDVVKNSPEGFDFNGSKVVFEGSLEPSESGLFHFYLYYAGYTKVWMDGMQVMPEIWRTAWNPNGRKFELELEKGRKVPIRIEWEPDGGVSYNALRVLSPVPSDVQGQMSWWGEMQDQIDYYFIAGEDIDGVIGGYRTLTGKAPIMPEWVCGYWQSRERYHSSDEILSTLKEFRDKQIPLDNIVLDWQYWKDDQWGSHEFDPERFPDPKAMVDSIHAADARFMISVWPKFYVGTKHFEELDEKGYIYRVPVDQHVIDWLGHEQSFYDPYSQEARDIFWRQMKETLYPTGVDAWWMDASEPNIHDCTDLEFRKAMQGPTAIGSSTQYLNAYAYMNAKAIYEGQRGEDRDKRVFLLTRNGFAGLQRWSTASWSGDIGTRWEDMKAQISAGLNYSMSGIPFWGQDVGGFSVENRYSQAQQEFDHTGNVNADLEEWRELNVRWHQWGVFCPLYRSHGQFPFREPWNISPEGTPAYNAIVEADRLRYRMMPYIYTMASRVHFDDYTIMRPLVMDFTDDAVARGISDEFMFGDAFLVCPVYEYEARMRDVYLPEGGWYDLNDKCRYIRGGKTFRAPAPFESIPLYARYGQIVPFAEPGLQSTADMQGCNIRFVVYAGKDASYCLYEDDGVSYAYEKGACSRIPVKWNETTRTLTIGAREGKFDGMVPQRHFLAVVYSPDGSSVSDPIVYDGQEVTVKF